MARHFLILGGATLFLALLLGYSAFSLVETEEKVLAAAEAEGRALLHAVSTAVERSLEASPEVERLLAEHLGELARDLGEDLAANPGREEIILRSFVTDHGLKGAVLLDSNFAVRANAGPLGPAPPLSPGGALVPTRLEPMVVEDLVRRARERGLGEKQVVTDFGESPFGTRVGFLVARRLPEIDGHLLLRYDAEKLRGFRGKAGVERFLLDAADSEAISYLLLQARDGTVLAASDESRVGEKLPPPPAEATWSGEILDIAIGVSWEGSPPGTLRVGLAADPVAAVLARARRSILLFTGLCVLLGVGGALGLAFMDRVRRKREAVLRQEIFEREKVASLGQLAAGVAHEIRSPLNALGMAAQRLVRQSGEEEAKIANSMMREVARLNRTVEEFLDLGRSRPLEPVALDLEALVRDLVEAEAPAAKVLPPAAPASLRADPEELRKALGNLLRNARQAAPDGPVVVAWEASVGEVRIEVRDGGPGIPEDERGKVFEHFYTQRRGGTGLGLAIARTAALRHEGSISVSEAPEGGACFTIRLPAGEAR